MKTLTVSDVKQVDESVVMIQLEKVSKQYGRFRAIDSLSVAIRPGAVGLLGPNGAGKSTLIKALLGLVRLSEGKASVLGLDVRRSSRRIRQLVGYMPEDDCLFTGLSGVESVSYAGELAGLASRTALRRAHEVLDYVTIGEERYREVQTYSTGMKQKIKLGQALVHSPRLVFLDEPTTGLDPQARERMLFLIRNLAVVKGVSVVVSTHILKDVETCCDAVVLLGRGRLLLYDKLDNLRRPVDEQLSVRFEGDSSAFTGALAQHGCRIDWVGSDELRIWGAGDEVSKLVFQCAASTGTSLRHVAPSRNSLEEVFVNAVRETQHADL